MAWRSHIATQNWVNTGSSNGLMSDGTKPLPDLHSVSCNDIHMWVISQEIPQPSITKMDLKITYLWFNSTLPGTNELMCNIDNDKHIGANGQATTERNYNIDVESNQKQLMLTETTDKNARRLRNISHPTFLLNMIKIYRQWNRS